MIFDLAIMGGGPAGCAAAIQAGRMGARVLLLERGKFPRHKVCGEFVSAESVGLLDQLLAGEFRSLVQSAPRIARTRIFLDGRILQAEINPAAASIPRFQLDSALWNSCRRAGIECRSETNVQSIEGCAPFRLTSGGEVFESRAVINATGRWSNFTRSAARRPGNEEKWLGLKAHFQEPAGPDSVDLYFFDGGYCGVEPVGFGENGSATTVNACAMVRTDVATTLRSVLKQDVALFERSQSWHPLTEPVATSPLLFREPEPVQASMLQVGDAAAFVDPFIGDGISLALRSGALSAECLFPFFRHQCSFEQASARYWREYDIRLRKIYGASSRIRNLLAWPKMVRKPVLSFLAQTPFITNRIVRMTR
jgi:menaquinone-9 beta-reductase